ncbi:MAG: zinc ribbon domain-containing protein [Candidatus Omnitrophota bacterium]|jgi:putative FmdB family regulatory protein|nr:MAG: zinc ribbon domain-containing protein [Candidatus Omnitrophota bacterium]
MPTYEYECSHCGHRFEVFQSISAKHIRSCPNCKKSVKRLIGPGAGIIFKGSGFYATDYRKKPKKDEVPKNRECPKSKDGCNACSANP